jgi:hypothetical protein
MYVEMQCNGKVKVEKQFHLNVSQFGGGWMRRDKEYKKRKNGNKERSQLYYMPTIYACIV